MQILDFPVTGSRRRWLYSTEGSIGSRYDAVIAAVLRNGFPMDSCKQLFLNEIHKNENRKTTPAGNKFCSHPIIRLYSDQLSAF